MIELDQAFDQDGNDKAVLDLGGSYRYIWYGSLGEWTCGTILDAKKCIGTDPNQIQLSSDKKIITIHLPPTFDTNLLKSPNQFIIGA